MENVIFEVAWRELLKWIGLRVQDAKQMRAEVLDHYREPERAYHNLRHALRVLTDVKTYAHRYGVSDYGAVQLAALLHDVIYDTRRADNEARSAEFTIDWGRRLGVPRVTLERAAEIIRATQSHKALLFTDAALVLDADLAVLAAPWNAYDSYRRAIRREYAWVSETDWIAGRGRVLRSFLEQDALYHLPALRVTFESLARENIKRELSLLSAQATKKAGD